MNRICLAVAIIFASASTSTRADVIARWTFETAPPADLANSATIGSIAADEGAGTASGVHTSALTDWTTPVGNGSANSLSSTDWGTTGDPSGNYYQFAITKSGLENVTVSWDHTSSNTGPRDFALAYSADGGAFTNVFSYSAPANAAPNNWNGTTPVTASQFAFDLSALTDVDNATSLVFRLVQNSLISANGGAVAAGGTSRIDNFTVNGFAPAGVPEPSSILLSGLAVGGVALVRRRQAKQAAV